MNIYGHKDHGSVFSGMLSGVLEGMVEVDDPWLNEAGVSLYADSRRSSDEAEAEEEAEAEAEAGSGVKPWAPVVCICAAKLVWGSCVFARWAWASLSISAARRPLLLPRILT